MMKKEKRIVSRYLQERTHVATKKKARYEHIDATIKGKFIEPTRVILLTHEKACGHCPMTLFCQRNVSWEPLFKQFTLFLCRRCYALGFAETERYITSNIKELYVCMLLRTNRIKKQWKVGESLKWRYMHHIADNVYERWCELPWNMVKEMPYSCIARCRHDGVVRRNVLGDYTDCRTTLDNAIGEVVRY